MGANALDFLRLRQNKRLVPEEWKVDRDGQPCPIFFRGTEYLDHQNYLCARCLYWHQKVELWKSVYGRVDTDWVRHSLVAVWV